MAKNSPKIVFDKDQLTFYCSGQWTVSVLEDLSKQFSKSALPIKKNVRIDGESITQFDSAGTLALQQCIEALKQQDNQVELRHFSEAQLDLLKLIESKQESLAYQLPKPTKESWVYELGKESVNKFYQIDGLVVLIGDLSTKFIEAFGYWRRFQLPSIISNINSAGLQALPILGLLSFLIGVVLAYQMGLQLVTYGANNFIAQLSGWTIFREFGPLITAIIVAGRTSSAFTAQLGSMKVNEEIDAILTMGLSPTEFLVMPKVIGLLLVFPLLIFWSDVFSILGAMIMSKSQLGIGFADFLQRLRSAVGVKQMMLGLYKAPAFAILIALVGCFQGFRVKASADNIGKQTTKSVVQALFLIIIADAAFSIAYSWMKL